MLDRKATSARRGLLERKVRKVHRLLDPKAQSVLKARKAHQLLDPKAFKALRVHKALQAPVVLRTSLFQPLVQQF